MRRLQIEKLAKKNATWAGEWIDYDEAGSGLDGLEFLMDIFIQIWRVESVCYGKYPVIYHRIFEFQ
ncbi:MAG: hypothetical protein D6698_08615 [Gammaproteobacteria bacterium]|nr:MAG: hypothetical protein D6698_08615 [Gammaproteobacteria bacterium]